MLTKDTAICIRATDFSETSQILVFFTRANGKVSVIAKGSKRPKSTFGGPVEIFSHGKIVFSDSSKAKLATLTEFDQQSSFTGLAGDLYCLHCASFAVELISLMTEDKDPHPGLFDRFLDFLQHLQKASVGGCQKRDALVLLILFQLSLLKEVGLQPILTACSNCKNSFSAEWDEVYFSHSANGLVCRDCETSFPDRIKVSKKCANSLYELKLLMDAKKDTVMEIEKILVGYITEILGKRLRMARYVL